MCKKGDIILIESYKDNGIVLPKHSFVVLEDKGGEIRGCDFDIIALAMSSLKNKDQSHRKLSYPGNFPISASEQEISGADYSRRLKSRGSQVIPVSIPNESVSLTEA